MTYAFLIALAVGGLASGILAALWQAARLACVEERAAHEKEATQLRAELAAAKAASQLLEARVVNDAARLEAALAAKKREIAELEADLYACNSPGLVRERLRRMLAPGEVLTPGAPAPR